jgi:SAM-dependent methyltransferase
MSIPRIAIGPGMADLGELIVDEVAVYNRERWRALGRAKALFTLPWLDLDPPTALRRIDPWGRLGDVRGKAVLCLAGGGGKQSAAFALAGARVVVLDLAEGQLARDREAADHYGYEVATVQGDMRDLSVFDPNCFDLVFHPYSINFVPDCRPVFAEVARVLRPGGMYAFQAANPFAAGLGTGAWNGRAYEIRGRYEQGGQVDYDDESWVLGNPADQAAIPRPREYRHLLSTLLNGVLNLGFELLAIEEERGHGQTADLSPGEWDHLVATMPPWLFFWARLTPRSAASIAPCAADAPCASA